MAIRVRHRVYVQTSLDTAGKRKLFYPDPELEEVVIDALDKQVGSNLKVAPSATEALVFGEIAAVKGLYLEVDRAARVRLNGSADYIDVTPVVLSSGVGRGKLFIEAPLTGVTIQNTDGTNPILGVFCIWGDLSA